MTVGIFDFKQIGMGQRWLVTNKQTGVSHVTYGTRDEVEEQLRLATDAWTRRNTKSTVRGGEMKKHQNVEIRRARGARA